jgi:hypothetical protein
LVIEMPPITTPGRVLVLDTNVMQYAPAALLQILAADFAIT